MHLVLIPATHIFFCVPHLFPQVSVDVRFRARGGSSRYSELREKANIRIAKAVANSGAEFAFPPSLPQTSFYVGKQTENVNEPVATNERNKNAP